jgi:hypothetical protein
MTDHKDKLTFLETPDLVREVSISYNNVTQSDMLNDKVLMQLPVRSSERVLDVFVFD